MPQISQNFAQSRHPGAFRAQQQAVLATFRQLGQIRP
jgi:hypothetical protein